MTTDHYEGHLGKSLVYEDTVPFSYSSVDADLAAVDTPSQSASNLRVLRILWLMQDSVHEVPDEFSALEPTLLRLESKLDLLVELLGQYVSEELKLPEPRRVKISSQFLQWQAMESFEVGSRLKVNCYLIPYLPLPLVLSGAISATEAIGEGYRLTLTLDELDEQSAEILDKIIFRNHRRAIARQRQQS
jgi:hypothetical protein